jgi:hypothetical protein
MDFETQSRLRKEDFKGEEGCNGGKRGKQRCLNEGRVV